MQQLIRYNWTHSTGTEEVEVTGSSGCCPSIHIKHRTPKIGMRNIQVQDFDMPPQTARELMMALKAQLDAMEGETCEH